MTTNTQQVRDTSQRGGKGNFVHDPQNASEAGKKGGEHSHMKAGSREDRQKGSQEETSVDKDSGRSSGRNSGQSSSRK